MSEIPPKWPTPGPCILNKNPRFPNATHKTLKVTPSSSQQRHTPVCRHRRTHLPHQQPREPGREVWGRRLLPFRLRPRRRKVLETRGRRRGQVRSGSSGRGARQPPQRQANPFPEPGQRDRTLSNPPALRFLPSASVAHQGGLPVHLYPPQGASGSQAFRSPWAGNPGQLGQNVIDYFKDTGAWKAVSGCWRGFLFYFIV